MLDCTKCLTCLFEILHVLWYFDLVILFEEHVKKRKYQNLNLVIILPLEVFKGSREKMKYTCHRIVNNNNSQSHTNATSTSNCLSQLEYL